MTLPAIFTSPKNTKDDVEDDEDKEDDEQPKKKKKKKGTPLDEIEEARRG